MTGSDFVTLVLPTPLPVLMGNTIIAFPGNSPERLSLNSVPKG
jgi:hypothetical protein